MEESAIEMAGRDLRRDDNVSLGLFLRAFLTDANMG